MPKLKHQPPKYCKVKIGKKKYAAVYHHGKTIYLGAYGSPESKVAYTRFVAEYKAGDAPYLPEDKESVTVKELVLSFLEHVEGTIGILNFFVDFVSLYETKGIEGWVNTHTDIANAFKIGFSQLTISL